MRGRRRPTLHHCSVRYGGTNSERLLTVGTMGAPSASSGGGSQLAGRPRTVNIVMRVLSIVSPDARERICDNDGRCGSRTVSRWPASHIRSAMGALSLAICGARATAPVYFRARQPGGRRKQRRGDDGCAAASRRGGSAASDDAGLHRPAAARRSQYNGGRQQAADGHEEASARRPRWDARIAVGGVTGGRHCADRDCSPMALRLDRARAARHGLSLLVATAAPVAGGGHGRECACDGRLLGCGAARARCFAAAPARPTDECGGVRVRKGGPRARPVPRHAAARAARRRLRARSQGAPSPVGRGPAAAVTPAAHVRGLGNAAGRGLPLRRGAAAPLRGAALCWLLAVQRSA